MKTPKQIIISISFLFLFVHSVFSQKKQSSIALGVISSSDLFTQSIQKGSRTGLFVNYQLVKNLSFNANLSYGFKKYDLTVYDFPQRSQKVFRLQAIDLEVDMKWYFTKPIFRSHYVKNSFLNKIYPYVGIGAILRNPTKMVGYEIDLFSSDLIEVPFQLGYKKLDVIGGTKIILGVDLIFSNEFIIGIEFGEYTLARDGARYFKTRYSQWEIKEKEHIGFVKLSFGKYL